MYCWIFFFPILLPPYSSILIFQTMGENIEAASHCCPTCLTKFKRKKGLNQHKCLLTLCLPGEDPDLHLRDEGEVTRLTKTMKMFGSSYSQIIRFCQITRTVVPGIYPPFFCPPGQNSLPLLNKIGCVNQSYEYVKAAAKEGPVKLQKELKIQVGDQLLRVGPELLLPKSSKQLEGFTTIDKQSHFLIVSKVSRERP